MEIRCEFLKRFRTFSWIRERRFGEGRPLGSETRPASRRLEEGRGLFILAGRFESLLIQWVERIA